MVYVAHIQDDHALIFDGPVTYGQPDPGVLTSSNLADVGDSWELRFLPNKEAEWPALQQNANVALQKIELLSRATRAERRILDFGSGWGFFLAVAKSRGWEPWGLEPLPASAIYARAKFGLNVVTDTLHEGTFAPGFFDAVTSFQVFEHLPDPRENIRCLHSVLRRDGTILIEVPNFETWTMRLMKAAHRHFVPDHLNFFSIKTLSQLLVDAGFEIVGQYHPTRRMSVRHLVRRWLRQFLPATLSGAIQNSLQNTSVWQRTISLNIGDIIAVIGRKR